MTRVVLDANVLAPGFTGTTSASSRLVELWRQQMFELVVSEHLLQEVARVFNDSYFRGRVAPGVANEVIRLLRKRALVTAITVEVTGVATQPKDDLILATSLSAGAAYLATRDRQLLKLGSYQNLSILHPADLLDLLQNEANTKSAASEGDG